jgi:hypothetical protein
MIKQWIIIDNGCSQSKNFPYCLGLSYVPMKDLCQKHRIYREISCEDLLYYSMIHVDVGEFDNAVTIDNLPIYCFFKLYAFAKFYS